MAECVFAERWQLWNHDVTAEVDILLVCAVEEPCAVEEACTESGDLSALPSCAVQSMKSLFWLHL